LDMSLVVGLNVVLVVGLLGLLTAAMLLPHRLRAEPRGPQAPRAHTASRRKRAERADRRTGRTNTEPVYSRS
jgi:hypothetical protein